MFKKSAIRALGFLCAAAMLISAAGCAQNDPAGTSPSGSGQTVPNSSAQTVGSDPTETVGTDEPIDFAQLFDSSEWPVVEPYTAEPLLEADPDRAFYATLSNQDKDIYPCIAASDGSQIQSYPGFDIITREEYELSEISVTLPCRTSYKISVSNLDDLFRYPDTGSGFTPGQPGQQNYHRLLLSGADMREIGQQQSDHEQASQIYSSEIFPRYLAGEISGEDFLYWQEYANSIGSSWDGSGAYDPQSDEPVTDCHLYSVHIEFDKAKFCEESIEYLDLRLGDATHRISFGEWRLHEQPLELKKYSGKGVAVGTLAVLGTAFDSPYAGGDMLIDGTIRLSSSEPFAITGVRWTGASGVEVTGIHITDNNDAGEATIDAFWQGPQPLVLDKQTRYIISVYLYSERFREYELGITGTLSFDYILVDTGETGTAEIPCDIDRYNPMWDTYCLAFLGIDVGEYYHYLPDDSFSLLWLGETPESFRHG